MSEENGTLVGKMRIEQNLAFIINVFSDDILEIMLTNILEGKSKDGSVYTFTTDYKEYQIDERDTKCYLLSLYLQKGSDLSSEKIAKDVREIAIDLMELYKRDRIYVEIPGEEGEWFYNED